MGIKSCPKCGARWIDGQLFWSTGQIGAEEDLAGLVCNNHSDDTCINEKRGDESGDTWAKRSEFINTFIKDKLDELT